MSSLEWKCVSLQTTTPVTCPDRKHEIYLEMPLKNSTIVWKIGGRKIKSEFLFQNEKKKSKESSPGHRDQAKMSTRRWVCELFSCGSLVWQSQWDPVAHQHFPLINTVNHSSPYVYVLSCPQHFGKRKVPMSQLPFCSGLSMLFIALSACPLPVMCANFAHVKHK